MKRMRFYMMLAMVCCAVVSVRAQGHGWAQYSFSGAYENFAHTFENSGYTLAVEAEGHSKRRVYGAFLGRACQLTKVPSRLRWNRISAPSAIIWLTRRRRCCLP